MKTKNDLKRLLHGYLRFFLVSVFISASTWGGSVGDNFAGFAHVYLWVIVALTFASFFLPAEQTVWNKKAYQMASIPPMLALVVVLVVFGYVTVSWAFLSASLASLVVNKPLAEAKKL